MEPGAPSVTTISLMLMPMLSVVSSVSGKSNIVYW